MTSARREAEACPPIPEDRFCDIVMKGGTTSGVVYPGAVAELAERYRFHSIGGTSAGAIAAALTAAAEYRRRHSDGRCPHAGFEQLRRLPEVLGESVPMPASFGRLRREGAQDPDVPRLLSLFQPQPATRRLFQVLVHSLNAPSTGKRWVAIVGGLLRAYRWWIAGGAVPAVLVGIGWLMTWWHVSLSIGSSGGTSTWPPIVFAVMAVVPSCLPIALVGGVLGLLAGLAWDIAFGVVPNGFGLCRGGPAGNAEEDPPGPSKTDTRRESAPSSYALPLTVWLHRQIQQAAGLPFDEPLTFEHLWHAPGYPTEPFPLPTADKEGKPLSREENRYLRSIDLQIVTTSLTHGRPFLVPLQDQSSRVFFKREDLEPYFPDVVLDAMFDEAAAQPYSPATGADGRPLDPPVGAVTEGLFEIAAGKLPVVVAARLSLSFPLLVSAVPAWSIDYTPYPATLRRVRRCWFSDGGICSNFPIHMFDASLPPWPTFGLSLHQRHSTHERAWLPDTHLEGRADDWRDFDEDLDSWTLFGRFVWGIVGTMQNWKDSTSARMPGFRDRIVHIGLDADEGGLNLNMDKEKIERLSGYGALGGKKLICKFLPKNGDAYARGWSEHRWVRFNVLLNGVRERTRALRYASREAPHAMPLPDQIQRARTDPPLGCKGEVALSEAQAAALHRLLEAMESVEKIFDELEESGVSQPYSPTPEPALRSRPPF